MQRPGSLPCLSRRTCRSAWPVPIGLLSGCGAGLPRGFSATAWRWDGDKAFQEPRTDPADALDSDFGAEGQAQPRSDTVADATDQAAGPDETSSARLIKPLKFMSELPYAYA